MRSVRWAAVAALVAACGAEPELRGYTYDPPYPATWEPVPDAEGRAFDLNERARDATLLFFGFTNCPDVCPVTLAEWRTLRERLGDDARRVDFIMVSVDPDRDTPATVQAWVENFDPAFVGLAPDTTTLAEIERGYGIRSQRILRANHDGEHEASVSHSPRVFLIDGQGLLRANYAEDAAVDDLEHDVRTLLRAS